MFGAAFDGQRPILQRARRRFDAIGLLRVESYPERVRAASQVKTAVVLLVSFLATTRFASVTMTSPVLEARRDPP
jgi:hypothetical protein